MRSAKSVGRSVGAVLFVQLIGLLVPFILIMPIRSESYIEDVAGYAYQFRIAVFLLFANAVLTIGIAIAAYPFFLKYSERAGLWLLAFSVIWFALQAIDNAHIMSMLSLGQQYADGAGNREMLQALGSAARSARRWVHYTELLVVGAWFFTFYVLLFRFRSIPRVITGFGLVAVVLHAAGITLPMFFGYRSVMEAGYLLLISHLLVGGWLVVKGFPERAQIDHYA